MVCHVEQLLNEHCSPITRGKFGDRSLYPELFLFRGNSLNLHTKGNGNNIVEYIIRIKKKPIQIRAGDVSISCIVGFYSKFGIIMFNICRTSTHRLWKIRRNLLWHIFHVIKTSLVLCAMLLQLHTSSSAYRLPYHSFLLCWIPHRRNFR